MSTTYPPIPETPRDDVRETIHGIEIKDPYRWLEDGNDPRVRDWDAAQQARTEAILADVPGRDRLAERLDAILSVPRVVDIQVGSSTGGTRFFYRRRSGAMDQPALYWRDGPDGDERILVDLNGGTDGLTALDWWYPSPDGGLVAYGTSRDGNEWSTLQVIDVATGELLADRIERTRYSSVAWLPDRSGFFYTRYPEPGSVPAGDENYHSRVFFHRLGDDPIEDPLVFGAGMPRETMFSVHLSSEGRWLIVVAREGWVRSTIHVRDRTLVDGPWVTIVEGRDALFDNVRVAGDRIFLLTNEDAPNYKVIAGELPEILSTGGLGGWETILPNSADRVIDHFTFAGGHLLSHQSHRATSEVWRHAMDGSGATQIELPGIGTVGDLDGDRTQPLAGLVWTSYDSPSAAYIIDVAAGTIRPLHTDVAAEGIDLSGIAVEQVEYQSKDGTTVTMFLAGRSDVLARRDGGTPTILYGYGGFNVAITPAFSPDDVAWFELGGLLAVANLRGGSEYGEAWHRAGMLDNKQNVFDDFIAAARWLIDQRITRPERLAVRGGSNGGLLTGAFLTQAPELCAAVNCGVPLLDMVRYHLFSIARLWIPEYGSADDPDAFQWIHSWSPYHHVEPGRRYPAVLFSTADQDTRVDPLHARKMTALMQATAANGKDLDTPVLLRVELNAGHGQGKPRSKVIAESLDEIAFTARQLGVDLTSI
ncbi:MAG TPA: prolyl oligopeptidase family serine peptidase [Thermomicrobiales bacterium]|jgi:prolyl oligopeptidase|nr:prolyl oligopeptidase family serine peptidase [Thermomicrobiales bacterium]